MAEKECSSMEDGSVEVKNKPSGRVSRLIYLLIGVAVLLGLIAVLSTTLGVYYGLNGQSSSSSSSSFEMCQSVECLSERIRGAMNESVDPCEDFYNFTCGNWVTQNNLTQADAGCNVLMMQRFIILRELADVLDNGDFKDRLVMTELQDFYKSCTAAEQSESFDYEPFREVYRMIGGWSVADISGDGSMWGLNSTQFVKEKMLRSPAFYRISFDYDTTEYILKVNKSGLTLDHTSDYQDSDSINMMHMGIVLALELLAGKNATPEILNAAQSIINFEVKLAEIWGTDHGDSSNTSTVADLSTLWPDSPLNIFIPHIKHDWLGVLQALLKPAGVNLLPTNRVRVTSPEYFTRLTTLIHNTSLTTLENYAKWQLTWSLKEQLATNPKFGDYLALFRERIIGEPTPEQRSVCVEQAEKIMGLALVKLYAEHILPPGTKDVVTELVSNVMNGLRQRMMDNNWLDEFTKHLTIEKLDDIDHVVGYPDETIADQHLQMLYGEYKFGGEYVPNYIQYLNASQIQMFSLLYKALNRTVGIDPSTEVMAFYLLEYNQIIIQGGIMHFPVFNISWPLSVQYGGLGAIVGHELTHGFDNEGRQYDIDGQKRTWWSNMSIQEFESRQKCFVNQYSQYMRFGIPVDGNLTLAENIADNGGLKASYEAYKMVSNDSQQLPGLDYTDDQLFFIAFGQVWCSYDIQHTFRIITRQDIHSPNIFRVIGSVANSEEFAEAFSCIKASPMNPEQKCLLW